MRAIELGLVLVVGVVGCTLDAGDGKAGSRPPPPAQPGPQCAALNARAVSCGLLLPGNNAPCDEPETQREACFMDCFQGISCADWRESVCSDTDLPPGTVLNCIEICEGQPFVCDSGEVISGSAECDGFFECADGSDENGCSEAFFECDGISFPEDFRCDGSQDCSDGSDELRCPTETEPICN